jgi:c-di-GMP-binding flagellar brake protein YcgR
MNAVIEERRRSPRFEIDSGGLAVLPAAASVQILDISLAGILLQSVHPAPVGSRGRLRLSLGGQPFSADIEVRRTVPAGTNCHRMGVMFVDLSPEHERMIERFTQQRNP